MSWHAEPGCPVCFGLGFIPTKWGQQQCRNCLKLHARRYGALKIVPTKKGDSG